MMYRKFFRGPFLFLLTVVMLAGCNRQDDLDGIPSGDTPTGMPAGAIAFATAGTTRTKSVSENNGETAGWETVTVSLDDGLQTSGTSSATSQETVSSEGSSSGTVISGETSAGPGLLTRGAPAPGTEAPAGSLGVLGYLLTGGTWSSSATPNFMYNTQLIRTGSSGSYSYTYYPAKYWPDNTDDKVRFFAYYPYNGNGISLSSASATGYPAITYTPSANVIDQVDLLYAASTEAVNNKTTGTAVNFALAHALAQVSFSFKLEAALDGTATTVQSVELTGLKSSGTLSLDPSAGTPWTLGAGTASYTASVSNEALLPTANQSLNTTDYINAMTYTGYLLLLPQGVSGSNTAVINYTVDGVAKKSTYNLSAATWGMGQSLNYQVTLTDVPVVPPADPSNCHFIAPGASLVIPVGIKGNGGDVAGTGLSVTHTAVSVGIVWQTSANLITLDPFNSGSQTVKVNTNSTGTSGNAVIAAYDTDGSTILWSWHIWVTDYDPDTPSGGAIYTYNNRTWMDRNLGATTTTAAQPSTLGLLYQWGRKDPFPGSASVTTDIEPTLVGTSISKIFVSASSNLTNSILGPAVFYKGTGANMYDWYSVTASTHNDALWGGASTNTPTSKTIFDPCPAGWRVPAWSNGLSPWDGFTTSTFPWNNQGRVYTSAGSTYYPASGCRLNTSGLLIVVGSFGFNWSTLPYAAYACCLCYNNSTKVNPSEHAYSRAAGLSVRCVKE